MRERVYRSAAVLVGLAILASVAASCASSSKPMSAAAPTDIIAERQRLMKLKGASWADAQAKAKAGNVEGIAVNAETIAFIGRITPDLFPEKTDSKTQTWAKPEIWQKWDDFTKASKNEETKAAELRDASRAKDAAKVNALMANFGREACGACHQPFRTPKQQ